MIPTLYREPAPPQYSYALGAKAVSEALAGVPQYAELRIRFSRGWWALRDRPSETRPFRVLKGSYGFQCGGYAPGPEWEVLVCQVPREYVRCVRERLRERGLQRLRRWCENAAYLHGREGWHECVLWFDPLTGELTAATEDR